MQVLYLCAVASLLMTPTPTVMAAPAPFKHFIHGKRQFFCSISNLNHHSSASRAIYASPR